jgi:hypothetical protein
MKAILMLPLLLLAGCASTEPTLTIKIDSKPRDVYVYVKNKTRGGRLGLEQPRGEMGVVPEWDPVNMNGQMPITLKWPLPLSDEFFMPLTFKAVPIYQTNTLFPKVVVCDPDAQAKGKNRTCMIFFDLTKP